MTTNTASMVEWVKYSSYGVPFGLPMGDTDGDGDLDTTDVGQIKTWWGSGPYDVRGDLDLDGDVDATDFTMAKNASPITLGWGVLSHLGNRKGYAGYELDDALAGAYRLYHVRNRVLNSDLGRWLRRDPLGYVDGANLYEYVSSNPMMWVDPQGTCLGCLARCLFGMYLIARPVIPPLLAACAVLHACCTLSWPITPLAFACCVGVAGCWGVPVGALIACAWGCGCFPSPPPPGPTRPPPPPPPPPRTPAPPDYPGPGQPRTPGGPQP